MEDFIELLALACGQYAQVSHQIDAFISLVESSGQSAARKCSIKCKFVDETTPSDSYDTTDGAGAVVFVCCICVRGFPASYRLIATLSIKLYDTTV